MYDLIQCYDIGRDKFVIGVAKDQKWVLDADGKDFCGDIVERDGKKFTLKNENGEVVFEGIEN